MRFRLIANYLGAPYQAALGPEGDEVTLFAACPPPEELGFSSAAGHWRKLVTLDDIDDLRQSRPTARYRDERCLVVDDQGERLHIAYLGRDPERARELGYWEIDREVFEMVVPRTEVTELAEEQLTIAIDDVLIPSADPLISAAPVLLAAPEAPEASAHQPHPEPVSHANDNSNSNSNSNANGNGYHPTLDRVAAWHGSPEPEPDLDLELQSWTPGAWHSNGLRNGSSNGNGSAGQHHQQNPRTARQRERTPIQAVFDELLDLAAIPQSAYAVDDEVPGAMCLMKTDGGFEVFASSDEARLEVRFFEDEEAAYFYLFGVLAAEAVHGGLLGPIRDARQAGPASSQENISKYLQDGNCPY
jgi:hypothetical protein